MKKRIYKLTINSGKELKHPVQYSYGNTKDIELHIRKNSAMIVFSQSVPVKDPESVFRGRNRLCADALKKVLLIHLMCFNEAINVKTMELALDGEAVASHSIQEGQVLYSMVTGKIKHPFSAQWQDEEILKYIAGHAKSAWDGRMNSLIALLISKTREYRSERFLYLWMAMNGLYGFYSDLCKNMEDCRLGFTKENKQLDLLCRIHNFGVFPSDGLDDHRKKVLYEKGLSVLKRLQDDGEELYDRVMAGEDNSLKKRLDEISDEEMKDIQIDEKAFMLVWLPYQIRCKYFHNNEAMPVFLFEEEGILKALDYCNVFMDNFLTDTLSKWVTDNAINDESLETIHDALMQLQSR